ncbi:citrate lyase holo-[acyl-carrier protein] synthase [Budvicia diplopodorum]|uniref:citrate lyase holo-[acyl-carrier protein] synthase n=1 Tax=Budvicia diplopodorum TaxID=1119056 RepID=UPI00135B4C46|nr:citrate lyase holo-[acyl-carrier protein] synthase [Budvicia diplopodorum]
MLLLPEQATNHKVTLLEILLSRESRQQRQRIWLADYQTTVVSLTMVIPGEIKDSELSRKAFNQAWDEINQLCNLQSWMIQASEVFNLPTGAEGLLAIKQSADVVKHACVAMEQNNPLGRLWDIDVIGEQGSISRQAIGMPPRSCFICDLDARVCARQRTHSIQDLHAAMEALFHHADVV